MRLDEATYRAAERRLWDSVGLQPSERTSAGRRSCTRWCSSSHCTAMPATTPTPTASCRRASSNRPSARTSPAELRRLARTGSAVDALVVAIAEPGGTVLTGDRAGPRVVVDEVGRPGARLIVVQLMGGEHGTGSRERRTLGHWPHQTRPRRCRPARPPRRRRIRCRSAAASSLRTAGHRRFNRSTGRSRGWPPPGRVGRWRCRRTAARLPVATRGTPRRRRRACRGTG
jgi:hypothetical protein